MLELASRHCNPQNNIPSSALLSYSVQPTKPPPPCDNPTNRARQVEHPTTFMDRSNDWARTWLTFRHPCNHCFEWGHWAIDCPWKKARLPAVKDPRAKNCFVRLKQSNHCHQAFKRKPPLTWRQSAMTWENPALFSWTPEQQIWCPIMLVCSPLSDLHT